MLPYYLIQFPEKLFEFKHQVEERKERNQERLLADQNLGELLHMQIKRKGRKFILKYQKW